MNGPQCVDCPRLRERGGDGGAVCNTAEIYRVEQSAVLAAHHTILACSFLATLSLFPACWWKGLEALIFLGENVPTTSSASRSSWSDDRGAV